jgi:glycosyltransferase involved in cell wall biosynthesis
MTHIAIFCKTFLKGGAEKQALILTKLLNEREINVCLINWYGNKIDKRNLKFISDNSFKYFPLSGNYIKKLIVFRKILKKEGISILISYLTLPNFVSGINRILNRNIISLGGIRNDKLPFVKFLFEKLIHNYLNDATVFNNHSAKEKFITRGFNPAKIYVIQNAIDQKKSQFEKSASNGEIKIVTVGRFVKQKDYTTALKAFSELVKRNKEKSFKYSVVGYGPLEKEIKLLAEVLKIEQNVQVIINPPDIHDILAKSDIFLSTSLFEGVSNSIMEAMIAGLPVVATDVGDNKWLIKNGQNGFIVPCRDIDQIVSKLEYLSGSEEIRKNFGQTSINVIESEFSNSKFLENYLKLFSKFQKA